MLAPAPSRPAGPAAHTRPPIAHNGPCLVMRVVGMIGRHMEYDDQPGRTAAVNCVVQTGRRSGLTRQAGRWAGTGTRHPAGAARQARRQQQRRPHGCSPLARSFRSHLTCAEWLPQGICRQAGRQGSGRQAPRRQAGRRHRGCEHMHVHSMGVSKHTRAAGEQEHAPPGCRARGAHARQMAPAPAPHLRNY